MKNRSAKRLVQHEIAELNAKSFAYLGNVTKASPWFLYAYRTGSVRIDTAVQMLFAESHTKVFSQGRIIVTLLAPFENVLGPRALARLEKESYRQFVRALARRPHE